MDTIKQIFLACPPPPPALQEGEAAASPSPGLQHQVTHCTSALPVIHGRNVGVWVFCCRVCCSCTRA